MENHHEGHHETHHHEGHHGEHATHSGAKRAKKITFSLNTRQAVGLIVVVVLMGLFFQYKGIFIAATVDGAPISRFAVVHELEKASGKAALDALIVKKLVANEATKRGIAITDAEVEAELTKIRQSIVGQGQTLEQILEAQGRTMAELKDQIRSQKTVEKFVADKLVVSPEEIKQFIKENKITIPTGQEERYDGLVRDQLYQQKLGVEAKAFVDKLRTEASVKTYVSY